MKRLLVIICSTLLLAGCQSHRAEEVKFSGTLELTEHSLGAKTGGRLVKLEVYEGSIVKAGQILGVLDRYQQTKRDYERLQEIYKQGGATQQELEYAALAIEDQQIVAPIDGIVLVKVREVGEVLTPGAPVVVLGDRSHLWIRIYVPQRLINRIKMDQPAELTFDGIQQKFKGHVSFVATQAEFTPRNVQTQEERITQTFAVKISLDQPPDFLRPGVAADVSLWIE